ncbi:MAG TPA: DNA polymerase IV, partial [Vicinamibacterales bacterium]|nr:DNA polymerase IV [Vicinamibacterales bacterium]
VRGKPVIVGGGGPNDRGVVSTASYEARVYGVRSAMPLRTAGALCPDAVFVPVDGRKYARVSRQIMDILRRFTPLIEPLSIDEAFLDLTGTEVLFGAGEQAGQMIKQAIRDEVQLTASVGVAANRLVAKIASDLRKPDGLVVVPPGQEAQFLAPLAIERLWGVGASTRRALDEYGVKTIGDLAALPTDVLVRRFGSHGAALSARARGVGDTEVGHDVAAKSISHEHTFHADTDDWGVIDRTLLALSEGVGGRLRSAGVLAATVAVKIRDSDFVTITRQKTLDEPTDSTDVIWQAATALAKREVKGMRVRLLGVAATGLTRQQQLALFTDEDARHRRAVEATDALRKRHGARVVQRASLLEAKVAQPFERDPGGPRNPELE